MARCLVKHRSNFTFTLPYLSFYISFLSFLVRHSYIYCFNSFLFPS